MVNTPTDATLLTALPEIMPNRAEPTTQILAGPPRLRPIAVAAMGRRRGGPAKICVVGSALFGMISGSAVSNVASVGVFTIPMMKRTGYSARDAGAIEPVGSTGR